MNEGGNNINTKNGKIKNSKSGLIKSTIFDFNNSEIMNSSNNVSSIYKKNKDNKIIQTKRKHTQTNKTYNYRDDYIFPDGIGKYKSSTRCKLTNNPPIINNNDINSSFSKKSHNKIIMNLHDDKSIMDSEINPIQNKEFEKIEQDKENNNLKFIFNFEHLDSKQSNNNNSLEYISKNSFRSNKIEIKSKEAIDFSKYNQNITQISEKPNIEFFNNHNYSKSSDVQIDKNTEYGPKNANNNENIENKIVDCLENKRLNDENIISISGEKNNKIEEYNHKMPYSDQKNILKDIFENESNNCSIFSNNKCEFDVKSIGELNKTLDTIKREKEINVT